jgi:lipopolysaccharide transport system permease protein
LFVGLTVFNIFSDVANRSTTLIVGMPNYVKKVVFPLEIYPVVILAVALIMSLVNIVLLLIATFIASGEFSLGLFLLPLAYLPLISLCLGFAWIVSSLGVFIRDLTQIMPVLTTVIFFLSPVVYPLEMVPDRFQTFIVLNPFTVIIESFRVLILSGDSFPWLGWSIWIVLSSLFALFGYAWFMGTKKGFADVL